MRPRTIVIGAIIFALLLTAHHPIGQVIIDGGHLLTQLGNIINKGSAK